jgi:hypothetical protein
VRAHQARLHLLQGNLAATLAWAQDVERRAAAGADPAAVPLVYVWELEQITLARVYLAQGRTAEALARPSIVKG